MDICNLKVKTLSTVAAVHYHFDHDMFLWWLVYVTDSVTVKIITQDVILNDININYPLLSKIQKMSMTMIKTFK